MKLVPKYQEGNPIEGLNAWEKRQRKRVLQLRDEPGLTPIYPEFDLLLGARGLINGAVKEGIKQAPRAAKYIYNATKKLPYSKTAHNFMTGMIGGLTVDNLNKQLFGKSWGESVSEPVGYVVRKAGWNPDDTLWGRMLANIGTTAAEFTNPGYLLSPAGAEQIGETTYKGLLKLKPTFGYVRGGNTGGTKLYSGINPEIMGIGKNLPGSQEIEISPEDLYKIFQLQDGYYFLGHGTGRTNVSPEEIFNGGLRIKGAEISNTTTPISESSLRAWPHLNSENIIILPGKADMVRYDFPYGQIPTDWYNPKIFSWNDNPKVIGKGLLARQEPNASFIFENDGVVHTKPEAILGAYNTKTHTLKLNPNSQYKFQFGIPQATPQTTAENAASEMSNIVRTVLDNGKIRLSLPSHTTTRPRQIVLEPQGNNRFYVHIRTWDGDHIPANITNEEKQALYNALYEELPAGAEILFPKSGPGNYGSRGTVVGLQRLSRDPRFTPGTKGTLQYLDKDGKTVRTYEGTSFIKTPRITSENAVGITPQQWTAAQDAAIARGDMAEAQRLRGLHFKVSAPNTKVNNIVYHGNRTDDIITEFDFARIGNEHKDVGLNGFWFIDNPEIAKWEYALKPESWGKGIENAQFGEVIPAYINLENPAKLEQIGLKMEKSPYGDYPSATESLLDLFKRAKSEGKGKDGFIFRLKDSDGMADPMYESIQNQFIVRNPSKIKRADAVTYDDKGVRIPLGERDNFNVNDIRYGFGTKGINGGFTEEDVLNFIDNDIIPRLRAQGHYVKDYHPTFRIFNPATDAMDALRVNAKGEAWFTPIVNDITLKGPLSNLDFGLVIHEAGGHGLRYNILPDYRPTSRYYLNEYIMGRGNEPGVAEELLKVHTGRLKYNNYEAQALGETYPWVAKFFEHNPKTLPNSILDELGTVNTLFRASLSNNGRITGKDLNKVIYTTPDEVLLHKLILLRYTRSISEDLAKITGMSADEIRRMSIKDLKAITTNPQVQKIISKMRETMKNVGGYALPITIGGSALYGTYQNDKQNNIL